MWFLYLGMGSIWCNKYFKYGYILVNKIICEDLMKITQIIAEIWEHLFLWRSLKIIKLRYRHYYYFSILGDVALNYHPTTFGSNCKRQCGYMDKTVKKLLTGGQKPPSNLRMDLDGELVVERNYRKTLFALRMHTPNAWNALICLMRFEIIMNIISSLGGSWSLHWVLRYLLN